MMMLDPFRRLFHDVGERMEDHLDVRLCDPSYRAFYSDGTRIDATPNVARMLRELSRVAGEDEAARYPEFLGRIGELYRVSVPHFVRNDYASLWDFAAPAQVARVARHGMLGNLARRVAGTFTDERLRQLFSFQTMYLGLSPFEAPWVYATLTYMEYGEGIWYPLGGMPRITETVAEQAIARGVEIRLNAPVARIDGKRVILEDGETVVADTVVVNADLPYAQRRLLGRDEPRYANSCSALVFYWDVEGAPKNLLHHNVFFGSDFRGNLEAIFHRAEIPADPAFYVCVSSRTDPAMAPPGRANVFVLVPCPNLRHPFSDSDTAFLRQRVVRRLAHEVGFDPERILAEQTFGPREWESELNLWQGAAFGISHVTRQSALFRPRQVDRRNPDVLYVGASTTPGNGLPMVLISAELAERRLVARGW